MYSNTVCTMSKCNVILSRSVWRRTFINSPQVCERHQSNNLRITPAATAKPTNPSGKFQIPIQHKLSLLEMKELPCVFCFARQILKDKRHFCVIASAVLTLLTVNRMYSDFTKSKMPCQWRLTYLDLNMNTLTIRGQSLIQTMGLQSSNHPKNPATFCPEQHVFPLCLVPLHNHCHCVIKKSYEGVGGAVLGVSDRTVVGL